jgi:hypothetical protein
MTLDEASKKLVAAVLVSREDVTRAKHFILTGNNTDTKALAEEWLDVQLGAIPTEVDIHSAGVDDSLVLLAKAFSLRLALYQAVWELVAATELLPGGSDSWQASVTGCDPWGKHGLKLESIRCISPAVIHRPPLRSTPPTDPDVFLQGAECTALHPGIREAVSQSLACFGRGLYLPAIVMLAAGAEATWIECGIAVATKLGDQKLREVMDDPLEGFGRKVMKVKRALEQPAGKDLLKAAGSNLAKVADAELWTTTLRERRNAVHWGKAQGFIAQHSEASSLLMAAPLHMGTLESVRVAAGVA